jgi:hypothetical protein
MVDSPFVLVVGVESYKATQPSSKKVHKRPTLFPKPTVVMRNMLCTQSMSISNI